MNKTPTSERIKRLQLGLGIAGLYSQALGTGMLVYHLTTEGSFAGYPWWPLSLQLFAVSMAFASLGLRDVVKYHQDKEKMESKT
jgi:hypothetical protein